MHIEEGKAFEKESDYFNNTQTLMKDLAGSSTLVHTNSPENHRFKGGSSKTRTNADPLNKHAYLGE
jgi:hypothetical protein